MTQQKHNKFKISKPALTFLLFFSGFAIMVGVAPFLMHSIKSGTYQEWYIALPLCGAAILFTGVVIGVTVKEEDF